VILHRQRHGVPTSFPADNLSSDTNTAEYLRQGEAATTGFGSSIAESGSELAGLLSNRTRAMAVTLWNARDATEIPGTRGN